jgi:hypothetical protein
MVKNMSMRRQTMIRVETERHGKMTTHELRDSPAAWTGGAGR